MKAHLKQKSKKDLQIMPDPAIIHLPGILKLVPNLAIKIKVTPKIQPNQNLNSYKAQWSMMRISTKHLGLLRLSLRLICLSDLRKLSQTKTLIAIQDIMPINKPLC